MASIHCLPNELLIKTFSYLHVLDVSLTVAKVSRRWNALSSDTFLWSQLEWIVEEETSLRSVLSNIPHLPYLRFITIKWRTDTGEIVDVLGKKCKYLEKIHFFSCGHVKSSCIKKISDCCESLEDFSLGKCYSVQPKCFDYVSMMKNLTALDLSHGMLSSEQFRIISNNCTKVNFINLDFVRGISEEDLMLFITSRTVELQFLKVFGELLTDNIFQHFGICQKLRVLHISSCSRFSKRCFESIVKLKSLKSLTLRKLSSISSMYLNDFFYKSGFNKKLSFLYISTKRTFTVEELFVWYPNDKDNGVENPITSSRIKLLSSKNCILILWKDGFTFQVLS